MLTVTLYIGIVKDYFVVSCPDSMKYYWCSSSTWVFSELPAVTKCEGDLNQLKNMNNMLTGEFDQVLFPGSG